MATARRNEVESRWPIWALAAVIRGPVASWVLGVARGSEASHAHTEEQTISRGVSALRRTRFKRRIVTEPGREGVGCGGEKSEDGKEGLHFDFRDWDSKK